MSPVKPIILFFLFGLVLSAQGQTKLIPKNGKDTVFPRVDSLKAATVTAVLRPKMKGDTLEYNTEHIQMQPNAVVEELLRRLPGLHVDPDGTITYNGEKIEHLLVDGEDIFGSTPTMVTRNFDASKIARIQILDRQSDQALFTGIDDGARTKTLNLVLKEDAKNGYFGKVEAGGNIQGDYITDGALAGFRQKEQLTALMLASNIGSTAFSADGSGGNISFLNGSTDALGASAGTGIPRFEALALHYANGWPSVGQHFSSNFQFSHYLTQPVTSYQSIQMQPDSIYGQSQRSQSTNEQNQQWIYGSYGLSLKGGSDFSLIFHGSNSQGQNQYASIGSGTFNDTLVNSSERNIQDKVSRQNFGEILGWRTKIGKQPNRIFSANTGVTKIDAITDGYLYSVARFYQPNGLLQSVDTVDQRKQISSHSLTLNGDIGYTEPLWRDAVLGLSYGISTTGDEPLQATYTRGDGKYQDMVDSLSSYLQTRTISQHVGLNLRGKVGRLSYTLGDNWEDYIYRQKDLMADTAINLHYINWTPRLALFYLANRTTSFNFNYNSSTQEPSIAQLAPIPNNSDPLHITLGNPNLKPGLNENFKLGFRSLKTWLINLDMILTLVTSSISTRTITDSLGRQVSQPVNVDGGATSGLNFSLSRKMAGFEAGLHATGTYSRTESYVNADLSNNDSYMGGGGGKLSRYEQDKYQLDFNTNFSYFDQVSSVNASAPVHYWSQSYTGSVTLYFIKHFEINTNANYTWQEKTSGFGTNTSVLLWNSFVSRNLMQNRLVVRVQMNNILNANSGISRSNSGNVNSQSATNILGRYWMLSVVYHFDKKFKGK